MTSRFAPIIRTQADLEAAWRRLMGPGAYAGASIWLMLVLEDGRVRPALTEITRADEPPDEEGVRLFAEVLTGLDARPGDRLAFLRSRPGGPRPTDADRAWAAALYRSARVAGIACEVVHLATEGDVRPLPRDELAATA
jgi:hypothetical protein